MFVQRSTEGYRELVPGIRMRSLALGADTHLVEVYLAQGAILSEHHHINEQPGYLVSGKLKLVVDGVEHIAGPGDSWSIPPDVPHWAETLEDSLAIEVFSPIREDYLPKE